MPSLPEFKTNAIITGEGYEWFYEIKTRMMVRIPLGAPVMAYERTEDEKDRLIVETMSGSMIRVDKDRIFFLKEH